MSERKPLMPAIKKIWPLLASVGSAGVMMITFLIPSLQDQWDRYESRKIIQQYVELGDEFFTEKNYKLAEETYKKAYELSEEKRIDIEEKRLRAKINLIYQDLAWGSDLPEGLEDVDFQFLLHLQKGVPHNKERAETLTSYGIYLASVNRKKEAEKVINEAILLNPNEPLAYINLGNLMDELGKRTEAGGAYRKAISLDPRNVQAHYNLGLLFSESGKVKAANREFAKAIELDPADSDAINEQKLLWKQFPDSLK